MVTTFSVCLMDSYGDYICCMLYGWIILDMVITNNACLIGSYGDYLYTMICG